MTILFAGTTIICGIGWLVYWAGTNAIVKYMLDKGYKPPSDEEMKECSLYVWRKLFHIK